ncbi:PREDICTED: uncharacterized protein At5g48480-like [Camelina sativa]|uniref:Uncharacterized protein At5g48480-like n=1 Tax=Camelina sativa TaxID=90675 RepID=A0ABM0Y0L4_CAMSA|nr:PREDICTED: uncharacterized protein At5g48480-like [Camelina sativa]
MAQDGVTADGANGGATTAAVVEKPVTFTAFKTTLTVEAQKVSDAVTFYKSAFGAIESGQSLYPKRKLDQELPHVLSSELNLAGSSFVVRDVTTLSGFTAKSEGTTMTLTLETDDVEAAVAKAVSAGAVKVEVTEVETEGGVQGKVTDPFGFTWIFSAPAKKIENAAVNDENKEV